MLQVQAEGQHGQAGKTQGGEQAPGIGFKPGQRNHQASKNCGLTALSSPACDFTQTGNPGLLRRTSRFIPFGGTGLSCRRRD
jgi:hypothetical protein